jgi:tetratricopeptide (TPR) repeat protein
MGSAQTLSLAAQHHQAGNLREAETLYRSILQTEPGNPDALHLLGVIAHQVGRNDLAVEYIKQALRGRPLFPAAYNNLGISLRDLGRLDEAIVCYDQAVFQRPFFAEALYNRGNARKDQGKVDEAIADYQQAVALKPELSEAHNNLANSLRDQGRLEEALASARQALRLKPESAEAHSNLGNILRDQGKFDDALASYQQSVRLKPNYAEAHNNLGTALIELGKLGEAVARFQEALRLKPDHAEAHINLGNALQVQGRHDEAIVSYRQALRLKPSYADAHCNLGVALTEAGHMDEAIASYREAIRLKPTHAEALCQLASLLRGKLPDPDCAFLERRLTESELDDVDRVKLLYGLVEVCNAKGEFVRAAESVRQANALALAVRQKKGQVYRLDENARFVANLLAAFTPAFFERVRGFGVETERPVFIVGLPRSGTTLTEQILAAHSRVYGAGELPLARRDFLALGPEPTDESVFATLPGLQREAFQSQAHWHLEQLTAMNRTAACVVDKMPDNYFYLGLLAVLFPRAKFIHCRRDLRDVAVSCWMTNFRDFYWANDQKFIAARFQEYRRLMEHWQTVLPVPVLEVHYEETVADLPGAARRLVDWCGLEWEPGCLKFNEGTRPIRTASKIQVREPVYTRSVGRWRHYERDLSELFAALNASGASSS